LGSSSFENSKSKSVWLAIVSSPLFRFWVSHFFKSSLVCLQESFSRGGWLFIAGVLARSFCKPSLFGYLGWLAV